MAFLAMKRSRNSAGAVPSVPPGVRRRRRVKLAGVDGLQHCLSKGGLSDEVKSIPPHCDRRTGRSFPLSVGVRVCRVGGRPLNHRRELPPSVDPGSANIGWPARRPGPTPTPCNEG